MSESSPPPHICLQQPSYRHTVFGFWLINNFLHYPKAHLHQTPRHRIFTACFSPLSPCFFNSFSAGYMPHSFAARHVLPPFALPLFSLIWLHQSKPKVFLFSTSRIHKKFLFIFPYCLLQSGLPAFLCSLKPSCHSCLEIPFSYCMIHLQINPYFFSASATDDTIFFTVLALPFFMSSHSDVPWIKMSLQVFLHIEET